MAAESCDHLGSRCAPGPLVIWSGGPPASKRIHICRVSEESETKATALPSGENDGLSSKPTESVSRRNLTALALGSALPRSHHAPAATTARTRIAISQREALAKPLFGKARATPAPVSEIEDEDSRWKAKSRAD